MKNETMDGKMNQLLNLLGNEQLVSTVGNVKDILEKETNINESIPINTEAMKDKKEEGSKVEK